ncbi:hypothetical protein [uncultured Boseongicola sp.]|uniref:hypothetical protein n=1 Tax=uncultured Boseongicola sp. TaxID=1648499 RepID=UPI002605565D|nr:hypothetical protein [uncultured Boseongicola sp.]
MALIISAIFVVIFVANVAIGSIAGNPILGNVSEMLLLFAASISFVVAILKREAEEVKKTENTQ